MECQLVWCLVIDTLDNIDFALHTRLVPETIRNV
jgi:hypothetical protein